MVLNFFFHHVGAMAWCGWPSMFLDSVKNMAPRWRMISPNGVLLHFVTDIIFCDRHNDFSVVPFFGSRSAHLAAPSDHHYEHTHTNTHTLLFCEIHPPFSCPDCINISQGASWSEDPPSAMLTQAFATVCLSNRPPRTRAGCISVQGRPASSTRCRQ